MTLSYILLGLLYALFGAFIWRLRGGAWNTLFNANMGTNTTRIVTGLLLALPVFALSHIYWLSIELLLGGITLGLIIAGWGPFMAMGNHPTLPNSTWLNFFPKLLGLKPQSVSWDFAGMTLCGWIMFALIVAPFAILHASWWLIPVVILSGLLFATIYLVISEIPTANLFVVSGFAGKDPEEWSEVVFGGALAVIIWSLTCWAIII